MDSAQLMSLSFRRAANARAFGSRSSSSGITLAEMFSGIMQQFVWDIIVMMNGHTTEYDSLRRNIVG